MSRRLLFPSFLVLLVATTGLASCGNDPEPTRTATPTLREQLKAIDQKRGAPSRRMVAESMIPAPRLIGVPLERALAKLRRLEQDARRAFAKGRIDRAVRFSVRTEVVAGYPTHRNDELVVSGFTVDNEMGTDFIASGSRITLYALPADRFERATDGRGSSPDSI